jgi:hypothetical protein
MIEFKLGGIECVTDITGRTLGIHGVPDANQLDRIIAVVRNLQQLQLTRGKSKMPPHEVVEIKDLDDLPPGFPAELKDLIGRLLGSRVHAVLFEEVPLYHFFETESGEKFCKTQPHRAIPILGAEENGTEVTFNRTRVVGYLGDDRTKLFPVDGVSETGTPAEKPVCCRVDGMQEMTWGNLRDGSWFTDGHFVYQRSHDRVNKFEFDGTLIGDAESYDGPKDGLSFLGFNVLDAWDLVEEGCKASS